MITIAILERKVPTKFTYIDNFNNLHLHRIYIRQDETTFQIRQGDIMVAAVLLALFIYWSRDCAFPRNKQHYNFMGNIPLTRSFGGFAKS